MTLTGAAVLAVLVSGVMHATWNALAKAAEDRYAAIALMGLAQTAIGLLALPVVGLPGGRAWLWALVSVGVHVLYTALLVRSYRLGDFSQAYPLARGLAPLLVAVTAVAAFGEHLTWPQVGGLAAICGGLGALAFTGGSGPASGPAVSAALLTGVAIAGYTLIDGAGARTGGNALGYAALLFAGLGPASAAWALAVRGRALLPAMRRQWRTGVGGGAASVAGYATVIWAQSVVPLAMVAALRETGVVAGAVIGVVAFHERMAVSRIVASSVVVAGVVLLNTT